MKDSIMHLGGRLAWNLSSPSMMLAMSEADQLPLAQSARPLDYSQQHSGEMVWIVRFCAAYLLIVGCFLPLLYTSIGLAELMVDGISLSIIDLSMFIFIAPLARLCATGVVAVAMWHLRREAFWATIVLILLPASLVTFAPRWELVLAELPKDSAIAVLVWFLYRRARDNGILRPWNGRDLHSTPAHDDLLFFLGLVGAWQVAGLLGFAASYVTRLLGSVPSSSPNLVKVTISTLLPAGLGLWLLLRRSPSVLIYMAVANGLIPIANTAYRVWTFAQNPRLAKTTVPVVLYLPSLLYASATIAFFVVLFLRARRVLRA